MPSSVSFCYAASHIFQVKGQNQWNTVYTFYLKSKLTLSLPVNVFNTFVKFVAVYSQEENVTDTVTKGKNDMLVVYIIGIQ